MKYEFKHDTDNTVILLVVVLCFVLTCLVMAGALKAFRYDRNTQFSEKVLYSDNAGLQQWQEEEALLSRYGSRPNPTEEDPNAVSYTMPLKVAQSKVLKAYAP